MRRKLSNYAAKLRRIFTKSAVIVRHFQLIFGSNWLQLCIIINDVVGRPDQTSNQEKKQKHRPARPRVSDFFFSNSSLYCVKSTAGRFNFIQAYVKVTRDMSIG